jgi:type VI secretion system protein VasG
VSLIDTACARVAISQHAIPPEVEDCRRRLSALETELERLGRESAVGIDHETRRTEIAAKLTEQKSHLERLDEHWQREREAVKKILDLRGKLRASLGNSGEKQNADITVEQLKEAQERKRKRKNKRIISQP